MEEGRKRRSSYTYGGKPRSSGIPVPDLPGRAACAGELAIVDLALERPGSEAAHDMAKLLCGGCEVRAECLDHALTYHEPAGIWGGLSPHGRTRLLNAAS